MRIRTLMIVCLLLIVCVGTLTAQTPPPGAPPEAILKIVLGLSDDQLHALQSLAATRAAAIAPLLEQLGPLQQTLQAALQSERPDPAHVGELVVAIHQIERQVSQHEQNYREAFHALLSDEQRAKVAQIHSLELALHAAAALNQLGL
ncbi:MAG TPA: periplasmic heavy metal sensor [Thermoanaerobaculia bacterium]|nr:periplasmic heavy metal sensor [Thermoanaerobaculia bacterium]